MLTSDVVADIERIAALVPGGRAATGSIDERLHLTGPRSCATSAFEVDRLLASTAGFAMLAADGSEHGSPQSDVQRLDLAHLLAWCTTHVAVGGEPVPAWADLSGVYPTADGRHLQLHCNFPHHADGVVAHLGVDHDRDALAAAVAGRDAVDLETELIERGMIAAVVRTMAEWDAHPHAAATRDLPLLSVERLGDAPPASRVHTDGRGDGPLDGVRVLDCSRVLAGPTAGQLLAGHGADVLRLGAAHLPAVDACVMATGFGKRNAFADLRSDAGRTAATDLLRGADVWIDAYRPGAMAGHGVTPERAAELRPGIVVVQLSAFDQVGPWAGRRGFDSIVQSTTGIRDAGGASALGDDGHPLGSGPLGLPVQALDYATGFLAAGVAAALTRLQRAEGGSWLAQLSLLRTRDHLVRLGGPEPFRPAPVDVPDALLHTVDSEFGALTTVRPFCGGPVAAPRRLGSSPPAW